MKEDKSKWITYAKGFGDHGLFRGRGSGGFGASFLVVLFYVGRSCE
jgi:hypothetical protein